MGRVKVKICGITQKKDLMTAVKAGADAVGFIVNVPSSSRNLTIKKAKRLMEQVPISIVSVVVTVSSSLESLIELYEKLAPNALQIHGEEMTKANLLRGKTRDTCLIRALSAKSEVVVENVAEISNSFDAILIDSHVEGKLGGTGVLHDWDLTRLVRKTIAPKPLILAGGLTPENVRAAIDIVQPYAVDVSSGVEQYPGVKDPKKVTEFVKNAKAE